MLALKKFERPVNGQRSNMSPESNILMQLAAEITNPMTTAKVGRPPKAPGTRNESGTISLPPAWWKKIRANPKGASAAVLEALQK